MAPASVTLVCACATIIAGAAPAAAQDTVRVRYQPAAGFVVGTRTDIHTVTTLTGFPSVPDGATLEDDVLIRATQRVIGPGPGGIVVEVAVDSVRGRRRLENDRWHDLASSALVGRVARASVSNRFEIVGVQTAGDRDADVLQALGGFVIGLGFAFPDHAMAVGDTIPTGGRVRTRVGTDSTTGLVLDEVMLGDLTLTLDSVVHAGGDGLAFFEFRGAFAPHRASVTSLGNSVVEYSGAFAGRLIWSEGWNGIVSAATHMRVDGRIRTEGGGGSQRAQATWDRTVVHRIQP